MDNETKTAEITQIRRAAKNMRAKSWASFNKGLIIFGAIFLVLVIAATIVCVYFVSNQIYRAGKVSKIQLGDSKSRVEALLGKPTESLSDENTYSYYPQEWLDAQAEAEVKIEYYRTEMNATDDMAQKKFYQNKITELREAADAIKYKYIVVQFEDDKVVSVKFNASAGGGYGEPNKWREYGASNQRVYFTPNKLTQDAQPDNTQLSVKIYYVDGSYQLYALNMSKVTFTAQTNEEGEFRDWQVAWNDSWGKYVVSFNKGR